MYFCLLYFSAGSYLLGGIIGTIGAVFVALVYGSFMAAMPRSGGEYVFLSRTMHPLLGYVINWVAVITMIFWWGTDQYWVMWVVHRLLSTFMSASSVNWIIAEPYGLFVI